MLSELCPVYGFNVKLLHACFQMSWWCKKQIFRLTEIERIFIKWWKWTTQRRSLGKRKESNPNSFFPTAMRLQALTSEFPHGSLNYVKYSNKNKKWRHLGGWPYESHRFTYNNSGYLYTRLFQCHVSVITNVTFSPNSPLRDRNTALSAVFSRIEKVP